MRRTASVLATVATAAALSIPLLGATTPAGAQAPTRGSLSPAAGPVATAATAQATVPAPHARPRHGHDPIRALRRFADRHLAPREHFTMAPDGTSGLTVGGEGIPNIDSVKATIRAYYAATDGVADKTSSPYISQMARIVAREERRLPRLYRQALRSGRTPAIVLDADDTLLWTYDMEDAAMGFNFDPVLQDEWVQDERFPATPSMVGFVAAARAAGFAVFGLTGRNSGQEEATLGNLAALGYQGFDAENFYTKWLSGTPKPDYVTCVVDTACTTVEYKAGTRAHIESLGYDIALNVGDQWSDLQGGHAAHRLKLPNPTYYLPSADLPGVTEPWLTPRSHFTMAPDGSSGLTQGGEGIPNIDSVKSTIRTYYAATGGVADKTSSPYISELTRLTARVSPVLDRACAAGVRRGLDPAIVLDADDTTLWTYDMEDGAMKFDFDPAIQNEWVADHLFPATPGMVALVDAAHDAGCTLVGLTGRSADQETDTIENLEEVGYTGFTEPDYYTKWATGEQPAYVTCAVADACTRVEYKSQTRAHVETASGGDHLILANFGDQFSDLLGGHALAPVKLPNPTYYLP